MTLLVFESYITVALFAFDLIRLMPVKHEVQLQKKKSQILFCKILKKQIVPCKSTAKKVSFEWSLISSTNSEVRTTLYSIIYKQYYREVLQFKRFYLNGHTIGFHPQTEKL